MSLLRTEILATLLEILFDLPPPLNQNPWYAAADYREHSDAEWPHILNFILREYECHSCGSERKRHWTMWILILHNDTTEWFYIADVTRTYEMYINLQVECPY